MPVKNKTINRNPLFQIGELVVVKSYPLNNPITGDPLSLPPIMVVCGIEIENKKKKTHDNNHGQQIAEFVKYKLVWFDAKKSNFIEKIMYESFLMKYKFKDKLTNIEYKFSEIAIFKTFSFEINKKKESKSTRSNNVIAGDKKNDTVETTTITSIVPFASPNFVMTGSGGIVEIQGTAEQEPFSEDELKQLLDLAKSGIGQLVSLQNMAIM